MTRVLVTGATGVLGRRAVPALLAAGHAVTAIARTADKAAVLRQAGAQPIELDLFDAAAVNDVVAGHDVVARWATSIPTGALAGTKRGWQQNDRLRSEAANILSTAVIETGAERFIQESITFPYVDGGTGRIDEGTERTYYWGNRTTVDAEAAAEAVTSSGACGVVLRFAMFMATDSAHIRSFTAAARRGVWAIFGADDRFISFIDADDAAAAVVAAIDAPAGVYNVAEPDPQRRRDHRNALAETVGRSRLRSMPSLIERAAGAGAESLARSHRISSEALQAVTPWRPLRRSIDVWQHV